MKDYYEYENRLYKLAEAHGLRLQQFTIPPTQSTMKVYGEEAQVMDGIGYRILHDADCLFESEDLDHISSVLNDYCRAIDRGSPIAPWISPNE